MASTLEDHFAVATCELSTHLLLVIQHDGFFSKRTLGGLAVTAIAIVLGPGNHIQSLYILNRKLAF